MSGYTWFQNEEEKEGRRDVSSTVERSKMRWRTPQISIQWQSSQLSPVRHAGKLPHVKAVTLCMYAGRRRSLCTNSCSTQALSIGIAANIGSGCKHRPFTCTVVSLTGWGIPISNNNILQLIHKVFPPALLFIKSSSADDRCSVCLPRIK